MQLYTVDVSQTKGPHPECQFHSGGVPLLSKACAA